MMVRVLGRRALAELLTVGDHLEAAESAFRLLGSGGATLPPPLHIEAIGGGFHAKGGALALGRRYAAVKVNGNFPANPERHGLPTVQGALLLFDGERGQPLALMDSIELTIARTAAATALAARYLARPDSKTVALCGCGAQAPAQLTHVANVLPIERVLAWDMDPARAAAFAADMSGRLGIAVTAKDDLADATLSADVIVTCTTARSPFLGRGQVSPGTFVAAVGADSPDKQELDPELLAAARLFTDLTAQCEVMGELHHALRAEALRREDVAAELADLVCGRHPGRSQADEVTVFDSTGLAVQDVAAAALAFERAEACRAGSTIDLA